MLLQPIMIDVNYHKDNNTISNISILDEAEYKILNQPDDNTEFEFIITTHYRDNNKKMYQLGFKIVQEATTNTYDMFIYENHHKLYYSDEFDIYFDLNAKQKNKSKYAPSSVTTAGVFKIEVRDDLGKSLYLSKNIQILPSSMSYENYKEMINDLIMIYDDLVINPNSNVFDKGLWEYRYDEVKKCLDEIENRLFMISLNPTKTIEFKFERVPLRRAKKITPKILVSNQIKGYNSRVLSKVPIESYNVYENQLIKSLLLSLKKKILTYKERIFDENIVKEYSISNSLDAFTTSDIMGSVDIKNKLNDLIVRMGTIKLSNSNYHTLEFSLSFNSDDIRYEVNIGSDRITCILMTKNFIRHLGEYDLCFMGNDYKINSQLHRFKSKRIEEVRFDFYSPNEFLYFIETVEKCIEEKSKVDISCMIDESAYCNFNSIDPINKFSIDDENRESSYKIVSNKITLINGCNVPDYPIEKVIDKLKLYTIHNEDHIGVSEEINQLNQKKDILSSLNQGINFNQLILKIEGMLDIEYIKHVDVIEISWKVTQVFMNNIHYNSIWSCFRELEDSIHFTRINGNEMLGLKATRYIYEYWCLFKMLRVLHSEMNWEIMNKDHIMESIYNPKKFEDSHFVCRLRYLLPNKRYLNLSVSFNNYYDNVNLRPDYVLRFTYSNRVFNLIIDAKYKNYREQPGEWTKDINSTAIKYYNKISEENKRNDVSSFIIHPSPDWYYNNFGGRIEGQDRFEWEGAPSHKFGSLMFLPSDTGNFKTLIKMVLEYKFGLYEFCWNCGNNDGTNITKSTLFTNTGYPKYYYKCDKCGEFWVKSHCSTRNHHSLIKHFNNYHKKDERKNSKWMVHCPKC